MTPICSYLTYILLQIILSVSKSNLTEQLLPRNRWRLYCSKMALGASLSRNSNWLHVSLLLLIHSERRCMSVASRSFNEQYNPVRRRIKYIFTLYFFNLKKRQTWWPQRFWQSYVLSMLLQEVSLLFWFSYKALVWVSVCCPFVSWRFGRGFIIFWKTKNWRFQLAWLDTRVNSI